MWKSQTDFEFAFIPLGEFQLSDSSEVHVILDYCPIKAHAIVKSFQKPNYLGARLKVDSQLNLEAWKAELHDYWDSQLIDLLYFGFPLDFNRNSPLRWEGENHKSALNFPRDIDVYLEEELKHKAIVGPFESHPCIGGHISPFLTREKPNSENRRVIVDLSWPLEESVNGGIDKHSYLGTDFTLNLPTIDHITDQVKAIGRRCQLYKVDISRAFRHIKVDPLDYDLLGLSWRQVFVGTCVPFGSRHGSQIFQHCSDAVRFIMKKMAKIFRKYILWYWYYALFLGCSALKSLTEKAMSRLNSAFRPSTQMAYRAMFRTFVAFCVYMCISWSQINVGTVLAFLECLNVNGVSSSMQSNYLAALRANFIIHGLPCVLFDDKKLHYYVKSLRINRPLCISRCNIIGIQDLYSLVRFCDKIYMGKVFKAVFLLAFFGFFRLSNLCPHSLPLSILPGI